MVLKPAIPNRRMYAWLYRQPKCGRLKWETKCTGSAASFALSDVNELAPTSSVS